MSLPRTLSIVFGALLAGLSPASAGYSSWTADGGPFGGRVNAICALPDEDRHLFIGTIRGGIYQSDGSGAGWETANHGLTFPDVLSLAADPTDPDTILAGTGGGGVYRSANRGDSWTPVNSGLASLFVRKVRFASDGGRVLAATAAAGIFYSDDRGSSWNSGNSGLTELSVQSVSCAPSLPARWYAATNSGVFRSDNGGASWSDKSGGLPSFAVNDVLVHPAGIDVAYAALAGGGIYRTVDGGISWISRSTGLGSVYVEELCFTPGKADTIWAATRRGIYRSYDAGANWTRYNAALEDTVALAVAAAGDSLFAGSYWGGVHASPLHAASWAGRNEGLCNRFGWEVAVSPDVAGTAWAASYGGVAVTADTGRTWSDASNGVEEFDLRTVAVDPMDGQRLVAGAYYGGVYRSADGGGSWALSNSGLPANPTVTSLRYRVGNGSVIVAGTYAGAYRSVNGGASWSASTDGMGAGKVWGLATCAAEPAVLFAGTYGDGFYKSIDFGASWTALPLPDPFVRATAVDPTDSSVVYAGGYYQDSGLGGIYKSVDGGWNWSAKNNGLGNLSIWCIAVDPIDPDHVIACTADGIYESKNGAGSWSDLSSGLWATDARWVAYAGNRLIAATYGGSAPWYEEGTVGVADGGAGLPRPAPATLLARPNPFNPRTTLGGIAESGRATLAVYDLSGRLVRVLFDGAAPAGPFEEDWDGRDDAGRPVSSGVYFATLRSGGTDARCRLLLIR